MSKPIYGNVIGGGSSSTIKAITEPCHIADLDEGVYLVKGGLSDGNGKVIIENISPESGIIKDYCYITEGTLTIHHKEITSEGDIEGGTIVYSATGQIIAQNHTYTDETQDDEGNIITFESVTAVEHLTTINAGIVSVVKTKTLTGDEGEQYEANTWYSFSQYTSSDIAATAIDEQIPENPTNFRIPSSLAVKNYVNYNSPVKTITESCHIADLDVGTYIIKSNLSDLSEGDELIGVTLANINEEEQLEDDFWEIYSGTLTISHKYEEETDEYIRVATSFVANGNMNTPDWFTLNEMQDDEGNIYMENEICSIKNASNVEMFMLVSTKFKIEQENGMEVGKWYSGLDNYWGSPSSNIPASALVETIDENSTRFKVPTAKAVYEFGQALQTDNDSSTIKTITTPCYIADLDVGTYLVNGTVLDFDNELGQVIIQNVTPDGKINDRYFILFNGIISITQKYIVNEDDTEERIAISFTASGNMSTPDGINITETTDKDGNIIMKETIATTSFSSSVSYIIAEYVKPKVDNPDKGYVAGQWYNEDLFLSTGDVSCEALTEEITSESTRFKVPTAKAVYDCVEALKAEIMGELDEIGDLVGGETGGDSGTEETITLIEEAEYEFRPEDMPEGCMNCIIDLDNDIAKNVFVEGGEYTLTIDGIPYQITLSTHPDFQYDDGSVSFIFGNLGIYSSDYTNTEEDYVGGVVYDSHGESYLSFILKTTETTHTVSLSYKAVAE